MAVQFKFRQDAPAPKRRDVLRAVEAKVTGKVAPLFPDEKDAELAALYRVEGISGGEQDEVINLLERADEVEFAEGEPERKLIR